MKNNEGEGREREREEGGGGVVDVKPLASGFFPLSSIMFSVAC